jgi:L-ascorbate metabolism protein UlaG (beta-lactamase superfamily)
LDENATLWSGWVVAGPTRRFYFAGDTGPTVSFAPSASGWAVPAAALPIGAYEPAAKMGTVHMNPE